MKKKTGILCLFLVCVLAGARMVQGKQNETAKVAAVFSSVGQESSTTMVEYYGSYEGGYLNLPERENFLKKAGLALGINHWSEVTRKYEDKKEETKLVKKASLSTTTFRLITSRDGAGEVRQYVIVNMQMDGSPGNAIGYREKIKDIMSGYCSESRSSANIIGIYKGRLSLEERNLLTDQLLGELKAKVITEHRKMQLYTVYAYTPYLSDYEKQDGKPVNVNIAMYYNEEQDETHVYAAVPIAGLDY